MMEIDKSYAYCHLIAKKSGSSFYRSFDLLGRERRDAMMALYAFARLADDAIDGLDDGDHESAHESWSPTQWHSWIDSLGDASPSQEGPSGLMPIRAALADSVAKYAIPLEPLHELVQGVDMDAVNSHSPMENGLSLQFCDWEATRSYCQLVASSVGVACLSIWADPIRVPPKASVVRAAQDCGVAFQLTNILRDIVEDAGRGRIYLPMCDLQRFGVDAVRWMNLPSNPTSFALNEVGDWRGLIRLQIERAKALYEQGWEVANNVRHDGRRMFSLMWHTYRRLLDKIEMEPESIWHTRIGLSKQEKVRLVGQHVFTPAFKNLVSQRPASPIRAEQTRSWPSSGLRVAVVGAGLAGISAAMHLARHGCNVTLLDSKSRIGGRVGSFSDSESGKSIDYCQHVGMMCCTELRRWIQETNQEPYWTEQDALHFVSASGKKIDVGAWPLPAPFHLAGLLLRWPQLTWKDRIQIARGLLQLLRLSMDEQLRGQLAIDWLRSMGQSERCIKNFWGTILVSALGEQVDRVTLGATHKVLVDGFAANRRAFHLLVPNRPLSELLDECVLARLNALNIKMQLGTPVQSIVALDNQRLAIVPEPSDEQSHWDAVLLAVPWTKVSQLLPEAIQRETAGLLGLDSSPITGVHTWWDRAWLQRPHAILVDRLCQWVFPASTTHTRDADSSGIPEHYYQIVISGSRELPRGDSESILKAIKQDLADIFPESAVATMLRGKVVTDPNAVFSAGVGHETSRWNSDFLRSHSIWMAGDWTNTGWPATMEGALRSGALAAQGILQEFGHDARLI